MDRGGELVEVSELRMRSETDSLPKGQGMSGRAPSSWTPKMTCVQSE